MLLWRQKATFEPLVIGDVGADAKDRLGSILRITDQRPSAHNEPRRRIRKRKGKFATPETRGAKLDKRLCQGRTILETKQ